MVRSGQKERWIIYTLATLLCMVLASFWLMCNIYARYTSEASGSDGARVAKFNVTDTGEELKSQIKVDMYPGFAKEYTVSVTNNSEVAIAYTIDAKNVYGNLPLKFEMLDQNGKEVNSADISANDSTAHDYKLKVSWPVNEETNTSSKDPDYAGKTDVIEITLKAVQKD